MKKMFVLLPVLLFILIGCSNPNTSNTQSNIPNSSNTQSNVSNTSIKQSDISGYWLQTEEDWDGDVTDLTNNPYAYLEITEDRLFFYTISFNENEGYGVAEKYYKLEGNKLYYDYYELKGENWKDNMNESYGGIFYLSFDNGKLTLKEYSNDIDESDGYKKDTYKKIEAKDWPIEE